MINHDPTYRCLAMTILKMFTGIVQKTGKLKKKEERAGVIYLTLETDAIFLENIQLGASLAVNGVCLTVAHFDKNEVRCEVMPVTLRETNLGKLKPGNEVNMERALRVGDELGGHFVTGHVDGTGRIASVRPEGKSRVIEIEAPSDIMECVFPKASISVDGISLTVQKVTGNVFTVSIVTHTQENTTLQEKERGDLVNLESDVLAKQVKNITKHEGSKLTVDYLQEEGF